MYVLFLKRKMDYFYTTGIFFFIIYYQITSENKYKR